jgi:hypothetical chaperone protein
VFGKRFDLGDLIQIILKEIKHRGELYVGHVVDTVVLGRPVVFSSNKEEDLLAEERLRTAALRAGFTNIHFVYEPIAATLSYELALNPDEEKLVFMGDFGGGTSDFVVMRLRGGTVDPTEDRSKDILAVDGVYIGGDALDSDVMYAKVAPYFGKGATYLSATQQVLDIPSGMITTLCRRHEFASLRDRRQLQTIKELRVAAEAGSRIALQNLESLVLNNLGHMLFQAVEQAKILLSDSEAATISFGEKEIAFEETITRTEFETIVAGRLDEIGQCSDRVLRQAGVNPLDIDLVLLTGGTSFIPCVKNVFAERFGQQKLKPIDAFTSVAHGLGLYAARSR